MDKSPDAFRTISEVADWLDVPTHVLRFWESRFAQVKPVKRAGGRRYYRPSDMRLIGGIKKLLHDDGMTIRGVQKLLREEGIKHVAGFSQPLEHEALEPIAEGTAEPGARNPDIPSDALESLPFLPAGSAVPKPAPPEPHVMKAAPEAESAVTEAEERADAAWSMDAGGGATAATLEEAPDQVTDGITAAEPAPDAVTVPPAPTEAEVVAFGSVRQSATPEPSVDATDEPMLDLAPPADATFEPRSEEIPKPPEPGPDPVGDQGAPTDDAPSLEAKPILSEAPDSDPEDDDPAHKLPASGFSRLILAKTGTLVQDRDALEQAVTSLRALRNGPAS